MQKASQDGKIQGIIFDLGGILVESFGDAFLKNASRVLKIPTYKIKSTVTKEEAKLQRGEETSLQFWRRVCKDLKINCPKNKILLSLWVAPYIKKAKIKKDTLALVSKLKSNYKLAILSNTIREHSVINKKRGLFDKFDVVLLSNKVGMRKPEREFFLLASKKLGIPFKNLVFVDDEMRWIEAALQYGLRAILFKNAKQLEDELCKLENRI